MQKLLAHRCVGKKGASPGLRRTHWYHLTDCSSVSAAEPPTHLSARLLFFRPCICTPSKDGPPTTLRATFLKAFNNALSEESLLIPKRRISYWRAKVKRSVTKARLATCSGVTAISPCGPINPNSGNVSLGHVATKNYKIKFIKPHYF